MKIPVRKLVLMAVLCLCFNNCLKAQYVVNGKEIDTSFNAKMNYIFGNLDKSKVPYGILKDYGMAFTSLQGKIIKYRVFLIKNTVKTLMTFG